MVERRHSRQQLTLKVEFDDHAGFRSNYLSNLSEGGVRINTSLEVNQRLTLNISFLGFVDPVQLDAVVMWSLPATHPDGPASGLAFVDPSPEAQMWLNDLLDADTGIFRPPTDPSRVLLLEVQPFLRDIYGQEVRNWAELRDEQPLELVSVDELESWFAEIHRIHATLAIVDIDGLPILPMDLYNRIRSNAATADLPLIVIGGSGRVDVFSDVSDDFLFCLRKPLRFGVLMNTVRVLARER